jgi:hypothetical protein
MPKIKLTAAGWLLVLGLLVLALQMAHGADESYLGKWKGRWDGAGSSGNFDLTLSRAADGKLAGSVAVGTEAGNYTAEFSKLTVTRGDLTASYDYPPDPMGEVSLNGRLEATHASGKWSLGAKGQFAQPFADGSWSVTKQ